MRADRVFVLAVELDPRGLGGQSLQILNKRLEACRTMSCLNACSGTWQ
jgi:hypothetical protein